MVKKVQIQERESGFSMSAVIRRCHCFRAEVRCHLQGETLSAVTCCQPPPNTPHWVVSPLAVMAAGGEAGAGG